MKGFCLNLMITILFLFVGVGSQAMISGTGSVPDTFTLDGTLYSKPNGTQPLLDHMVTFKIQIFGSDPDCILYEENQTQDTFNTNGYFNLQIGSPTVGLEAQKRTANDVGNTMAQVFSNMLGEYIQGKSLITNAACFYNPLLGDKRFVKLEFTASSDGVTHAFVKPIALSSVPYSYVCENSNYFQGFTPGNFIMVNPNTKLTQQNLELVFSNGFFPRLQTLVSIAPSRYLQSGNNGAVSIPMLVTSPTAGLTAGQFWYDSTNNVLKYYDGTSEVAIGSGGGALTTLSANNITAGTLSGNIAINTNNYIRTTNSIYASQVGIGTTSPTELLTISGGNILLDNNRSLRFLDNLGTPKNNITYTSSNNLQVDAWLGSLQLSGNNISLLTGGGSERMRVTTSGNVGIGSTSPENKLVVAGTIESTLGGYKFPDGTVQTTAATSGTGSSGPWLTNGANIYYSTGNVGLGTNSPVEKLTVGGNIYIAGASSNLSFEDNTRYQITTAQWPALVSDATNLPHYGIGWGNLTNGGAMFLSGYSGISINTNGAQRVLVTESGNVGIGTTSPTEKLQVSGNMSATGSIASNNLIYNSNGVYMRNSIGTAAAPAYNFNDATKNTGLFSPSLGVIGIANSGVESLRINASGNVGIGTTSPSNKLVVAGTIESTLGGYKFPDGSIQITAATVTNGTSQWTTTGTNIYYNNGIVSVGTHSQVARLNVTKQAQTGNLSDETGIYTEVKGVNSDSNFVGISALVQGDDQSFYNMSQYAGKFYAKGNGTLWSSVGVEGFSDTPNSVINRGVSGVSPSGQGVYGDSSNGQGVYGNSINGAAIYGNSINGNAVYAYTVNGFGIFSNSPKNHFSGNVGIGTTSPSNKLVVAGTIESTLGGFKFPDGTVQTTAATSGTGSSGPWLTSGTNLYYNSGFVGIGTASPSFILSLSGQSSQTIGMERNLTGNSNGNYLVLKAGGATVSSTNKTGGDLYLSAGNATGTGSSRIFLQTAKAGGSGSSERVPATAVTILGNGNVGIGTTTPNNSLDIYRDTTGFVAGDQASVNSKITGEFYDFSASAIKGIAEIDDNFDNFAIQYGGYFSASGAGTMAESYGIYALSNASGAGSNVGVFADAPNGKALLANSANGYGLFSSAPKNYFTGNVGIGTTSPSNKLVVVGTIESTLGGYKFPDGTVQTTAATSGTSGASQWVTSGTDIYYSSGNVGIGTTTPSANFTLAGFNGQTQNLISVKPYTSGTSNGMAINSAGEAIFYGKTNLGTVDGNNLYITTDTGTNSKVLGTDANLILKAGSSANLYFSTSSAWRGAINSIGNFGVGTIGPVTKLDVVGTLKVGNGGETCTAGLAGSIIYNAGSLQMCDGGGSWKPLTTGSAGSGQWVSSGTNLYYNTGIVSVGTHSDVAKFNVNRVAQSGNVNGEVGISTFVTGNNWGSDFVGISSQVQGNDEGDYNMVQYGGRFYATGSGSLASSVGVYGYSHNPSAVSNTGVLGDSPTGIGVYGNSTSGDGVYANSSTGFGIRSAASKNYFSGNVGIGTTTPGNKLVVAGTIESTLGGFKFPDGSVQTTAVTAGTSVSSQWTTSGTNIYYNSGNVGIGTTSPVFFTHIYKDVNNGSGKLFLQNPNTGSSASTGVIIGQNYTSDYLSLSYLNSGLTGSGLYDSPNSAVFSSGANATNGIAIVTGASAPIKFGISGQERFRIDSNGNLGVNMSIYGGSAQIEMIKSGVTDYIKVDSVGNGNGDVFNIKNNGHVGIGTTSPGAKLEVAGNIFSQNGVRGAKTGIGGYWSGVSTQIETEPGSELRFATDPASTPQERMRITTSGNVGIGTTSPTAKFTVANAGLIDSLPISSNGTINKHFLITDNSSNNLLAVQSSYNGTSTRYFSTSNANKRADLGIDSGPRAVLNAFDDGGNVGLPIRMSGLSFEFDTKASGDPQGTSRLFIDSSGNVGIGTSSPENKLVVVGTIESTLGGFKFPDGTIQVTAATGSGSSSQWITNGTNIYYNSGNVGIGTTTPSQLLTIIKSQDTSTSILLDNQNTGASASAGLAMTTNGGVLKVGIASIAGGGAAQVGTSSATPLILGTNNQERVRVTSTGNVGIGNNSPSSILSVTQTGGGVADFYLSSTGNNATITMDPFPTNGSKSWKMIADSATHLFQLKDNFNATYPLTVEGGTSTDKSIYIRSNGQVGIGYTPSFTLHASTNSTSTTVAAEAFGVGALPGFRNRTARGSRSGPTATQAGDYLGYVGGAGYGSTGWIASSSSLIYFKADENFTDSAAGGLMTFETTSNSAITRTERMRINSAGNVGIGTTTPGALLEVAGSVLLRGSASTNGIYVTGGSVAIGNTNPSALFDVSYASTGTTGGSINMKAQSTSNSSKAGSLILSGGDNNLRDGAKVQIDGANVTGGSLFLYAGSSSNYSSPAGSINIRAGNIYEVGWIPSYTGGNVNISSGYALNGSGGNVIITAESADDFDGYGSPFHGGSVKITTGAAVNGGNHGVITLQETGGNVGIGTTTPGYILDVVGNVNITTGSLKFAGTTVCTSAGCTSSSDARLKQNIQPLTDSLAQILQLRGVKYEYIDQDKFGAGEQVGVIAQEVEEIYPQVVKTEKDAQGFKSVAYDHLIAPVIEAIKELYYKIVGITEQVDQHQHHIEALQLENNIQKSEIEKLKNENADMKRRLERIENSLFKK